MSDAWVAPTEWRGWFRIEFILNVARRFYLLIACGSLLAALLALVIAAFFYLASHRTAPQVPIPPPYGGLAESVDIGAVSARLKPPTAIRFVLAIPYQYIGAPLTGNEVVGFFDADTPNGLALFPDDFDILGGRDAAYFDRQETRAEYEDDRERTPSSFHRAGLRPTAELIDAINSALPSLKAPTQRRFELTVVARDRFGNHSAPITVSFALAYGPRGVAVPSESDLQALARQIALAVDPGKTPAYFDAYQRALRIPAECGSAADSTFFLSNYRHAFESLRHRLNAGTIEAFYSGLCDAWREARAKDAARVREAEETRNAALRQNQEAQAAVALSNFGARVGKSAAFAFAVGAVSTFLLVSLFLAFLAMENHSNALRQAVQTLAERKRE